MPASQDCGVDTVSQIGKRRVRCLQHRDGRDA